MKKYLLFFLIITAAWSHAQNPILWGVTDFGGTKGKGNIFQINSKGKVTSVHSFGNGTDGVIPQNSLFKASNGLLYGMTVQGGASSNGMIFSYDISTGVESDLHDFAGGTDGEIPYGSLMQANNGLIYGMTYLGGANNAGVIFSYNITTGVETILHNFSFANNDGWGSTSTPIQATDGLLYGMTVQGGVNSDGVIFSYNIATGVEKDIHDFGTGTDGTRPNGSLLQASNGLLYGMTDEGGTSDSGTIFSYDITSGTETVLYSFTGGADGRLPNGSLIQASDSLLYGTTADGGTYSTGTIFSYNISTGTETVLYSLGGGTDGHTPLGSLFQASDRLLYGTTDEGGKSGYYGNLFSYNISTSSYSDFHDFNGVDGANLWGNLIEVDTFLAVTPFRPVICGGTSVTLTAIGAATYTWTPATGLNSTTGDTVIANPSVTTTYIVTGTINSTTYTDSIVVSVIPSPNKPTITRSVTGDSLISSATQGNQWYLNDTIIPGATNQVFVINGKEGIYTVTVINPANGCSATSDSLIISGVNGLSIVSKKLSIYPNPSSGQITINLNNSDPECLIEVYNLVGEKIYEAVLNDENNKVDLSNQPSGIYFVYLKSNQDLEVAKILITK